MRTSLAGNLISLAAPIALLLSFSHHSLVDDGMLTSHADAVIAETQAVQFADTQLVQSYYGMLIVSGEVYINGYVGQTGTTVLNGATITSGKGGATIELGPLGYIKLGPNTTIKVNFSEDKLRADCLCENRTKIEVLRGRIEVRTSEGIRTMSAGDHDVFLQRVQASSTGNTAFLVACSKNDKGAVKIGLLGALGALLIPVREAVGDGDVLPVLSPATP